MVGTILQYSYLYHKFESYCVCKLSRKNRAPILIKFDMEFFDSWERNRLLLSITDIRLGKAVGKASTI